MPQHKEQFEQKLKYLIEAYWGSVRGTAPKDARLLMEKHVKSLLEARGSLPQEEYDDDADKQIRAMVEHARGMASYIIFHKEDHFGVRLDVLSDRKVFTEALRVHFLWELIHWSGSYKNAQRQIDWRATLRLLSGHYDVYLHDDRVPLPFKWLEEVKKESS